MSTFNPAQMVADLTAILTAHNDATYTPASLAAISGNGVELRVATGVSDIDTLTPAQADQTFEIGSQTKIMTSAILLQLAEAGLVDLDRPASDHLPAAEIEGIANVDTASLTQLLNMTSGIPGFLAQRRADGEMAFDMHAIENPDEITGTEVAFDLLRDLPALFAPGEGFDYSNTNYALLGRIIEEVTGLTLAEAFDALIFEPLGMDDSKLDTHEISDPRLSSYRPVDDEYFDSTEIPIDYTAAGAVISSLDDMVTFFTALTEGDLLSDEALALMTSWNPNVDTNDWYGAYGMGLIYYHQPGGDFIGHTGGTWGTETVTVVDVDTDYIYSVADTFGDYRALDLAELTALTATWDSFDLEDAPITIEGISATDLRVVAMGDETLLDAGEAALLLEINAHDITGDDLIFTDGSSLQMGGTGHDVIAATGSAAYIRGFSGRDTIRGAAGDDRIEGNNGFDLLIGRGGDDVVLGGGGRDVIRGGGGDDTLRGDAGNDRLSGGFGEDVLIGSRGNDIMTGGGDADTFVFGTSQNNGMTERDVIRDFDLAEDALRIAGDILDITDTDRGVLLSLDGTDGDQLLLLGLSVEAIETDGLILL